MICFTCMLSVAVPAAASEKNKEECAKTVRVGYMLIDHFQEGGAGEYKTGYGYEYLQLISSLTGWHYEYVYGTFEELFQMLKNGEIDLMGYLSYMDDRSDDILYSNLPQGRESFHIYMHYSENMVPSEDEVLPSGARIGVRNNSYHKKILEEWVESRQADCEIYCFMDTEEMHLALERGEVDGIVSSDFAAEEGLVPMVHLGFDDFFLGVPKGREDVLKELNQALYQIYSGNRYVNSILYAKYYNKITENAQLSPRDKKWLEENNNTIRLGYLKGNQPYSSKSEKGKLEGVLSKLVEVFEKDYGIQMECRAFDDQNDMIQAMHNREIDLCGPLFADYYLSEQQSILNTNSIISTTLMLLHEQPELETEKMRIAYCENNAIQYGILKVLYPDNQLLRLSEKEECVKAIQEKKAEGLLFSTATLNTYKKFVDFEDWYITELDKEINICLGVQEGRPNLLNLVNRIIFAAKDRLTGASFINNTYIKPTLREVIKEHAFTVMLILLGIIAALICFILYFWKTTALILKMRNANASLSIQAFRDELTKTGNRAAYLAEEDRINGLLKQDRNQEFGILVADLNGLKLINDHFGHEMGDVLIKNASRVICEVFRKSPVFRTGGDEFAVVLKGEDYQNRGTLAEEFTRRCALCLTREQVLDGGFSAAWGISEYDKDRDSAVRDVYERADERMYLHKKEVKKSLEIRC